MIRNRISFNFDINLFLRCANHGLSSEVYGPSPESLNPLLSKPMDPIIKSAKTKQQLAEEFGVCLKTFNKWLKKHGIKMARGLITPKDQEIIYSKLGVPKSSE